MRLEAHPFAVVLTAHRALESSGVLVARRGPIEKRVLLDAGVPVDCRSNLVHETLSRFLASTGKLSDEDANAALSRSVAKGRLLGELLVEEERLDADELKRLLQQNLARKLFDLFTWRNGELRFESGPHRSESRQSLKLPRLIVTGVERFMPQPAVDRLVAPFAGALLARAPDGAARVLEVRLRGSETALYGALAAPRRMDELLASLGFEATELSRLLLAFALVGLVIPHDAGAAAQRSQLSRRSRLETERTFEGREPPVSPPVVPDPSPPDPGEVARRRERVSEAFSALPSQDPFELLGVGDDAPIEEVRNRYVDFARELAPWRYEGPELAGVSDSARQLFFAGALAFASLSDPQTREALRSDRRARREAALRESRASYFKIETDLLDAEVQFEKGLRLKGDGRLEPALQQFDFAVDCDPQNGRYRAEAAYCRYSLDPPSSAVHALEELREAQRVDPGAAEGFLYAGEICAQLRRFAEAEGHFRRAAKLLGPNDRRALNALHELGQRKRKKR